MNFYEIKNAHTGGKTYPWAAGYGPLEEMPFLEAERPLVIERTMLFWGLTQVSQD